MENREVDDNVHKAEGKSCIQLFRLLQGISLRLGKFRLMEGKFFCVCVCFKKEIQEQRSAGRVWIPHHTIGNSAAIADGPLCAAARVCCLRGTVCLEQGCFQGIWGGGEDEDGRAVRFQITLQGEKKIKKNEGTLHPLFGVNFS